MGSDELSRQRRIRSGERPAGHTGQWLVNQPVRAVHPQAPARPRARKLDLDAAPEGYDADIWDLVLFFQQQAELYGHQLAAGRLVLYAKLADRIGKSGIRNVTGPHGIPLRWQQMVKVMIMDFWDYEVWTPDAAHAIDQFCGIETFADLKLGILLQLSLRETAQRLVPQADRNFRDTPAGRERMAARQREQELPVIMPRPRQPWEDVRERAKRIRRKEAAE